MHFSICAAVAVVAAAVAVAAVAVAVAAVAVVIESVIEAQGRDAKLLCIAIIFALPLLVVLLSL